MICYWLLDTVGTLCTVTVLILSDSLSWLAITVADAYSGVANCPVCGKLWVITSSGTGHAVHRSVNHSGNKFDNYQIIDYNPTKFEKIL